MALSDWSPVRVTPTPGPRSRDLMAHAETVLNSGIPHGLLVPFIQDRKEDFLIVDVDGNEYVDGLSAWGAEPYGAHHPHIAQAMTDAWERHGAQISVSVLSEPVITLAERLVALAPASITRAEFSVTGTQAVESAVRIMREATGRPFIIVFGPVYHGESTTLTATMSCERQGVSSGAAQYAPGIIHLPYPNTTHSPFNPDEDGNATDTLHYLKNWVLRYQTAPDQIAGVMIEPVNTEGGVIAPSEAFWTELTALCDEHDWLLAIDEVQTGIGRTGTVFASDRWNLQPDLLLLGKALSAGAMPIAAILGSERAMGDSHLTQGSTFGWQPAACAAANAGLDLLTHEDTFPRIQWIEEEAMRFLLPLTALPWVSRIAAYGAEIGVEFTYHGDPSPAQHMVAVVHERMLASGVVGMGDDDTTYYRLQPPYLIPKRQWTYALTVLADAITAGP